jgi:radical SAM superfamily enzyme YgiQ (UPF0313 family)
MNIALIFPPFFLEPMYNLPPLGLINLATVLNSSHFSVKIFDFPLALRQKTLPMSSDIYRECARQVLQFEPDVAGFSVQCTTYPPALGIAEELRKLKPRLKIVFGGHTASSVDELTLSRFPFIDAIVRGEGEVTFPDLVRAFEGLIPLSSVEGVTFRELDRIMRNPDRELIDNLDSLPFSDYSSVAPLEVYRDVCGIGRSIAILEVGRGCPHRCIYCSQSVMWKRRTRTFSTDRIIGEMKKLAENFGAECFLLAFDQFTARRGFAEKFCLGLMDAGLSHLPWYCISRLDTVDRDLLNLMHEAGCETMCYGIDSGSKRTLAFIRKEIDRDLLFDRVRETTEAGIVPTLSFVIGFPEESRQDLEATLELALKSAATGNTNILVQMATILPGTDLYEKYRHGLVRLVDTYFSLGIEFDQGKRIASDDALIDSDPAIFSSFYNLPCPGATLKELNEAASYFTIIAALYPRSLLLLSMELNRPIVDLFFNFLDRVSDGEERSLTPRACLAHFSDFVSEGLAGNKTLVRNYIPEVVRYETCILCAGRTGPPLPSFHIGSREMLSLKPQKQEKVPVEEFTFDIPSLVMHIKSGHFPEKCDRRTVFLAFTQTQGRAEVREINEFGFDFLQLCDGRRSLEEIASRLYPKYGANRGREEFAIMCAESALTLAELDLLAPLALQGFRRERS